MIPGGTVRGTLSGVKVEIKTMAHDSCDAPSRSTRFTQTPVAVHVRTLDTRLARADITLLPGDCSLLDLSLLVCLTRTCRCGWLSFFQERENTVV